MKRALFVFLLLIGAPAAAQTVVGPCLQQSVGGCTLSGPFSAPSSNIPSSSVGTLSVTGNATVGGTLGVTGNTTLGGTLGVSGAISGPSLVLPGSTSGSSTLTAPATGGDALALPPGADTLVGAAATQTLTNKSIAGSEINSGTVSGSYLGPINLGAGDVNGGVTGALPNANLANSTITIGSTSISLGGTVGTIAGLTLASPTFTGAATAASLTATGTVSGAGFTSLLSPYAPLASPTLTGTPTSPTATVATDNTQIATTAFDYFLLASPPSTGWGSTTPEPVHASTLTTTSPATALSNLAGNPAAGTYSLNCTNTSSCSTSLAGAYGQAVSVTGATTLTAAQLNSIITFTGATPYTVTMPPIAGAENESALLLNATTGTITLSGGSATFGGSNGGGGTSTFTLGAEQAVRMAATSSGFWIAESPQTQNQLGGVGTSYVNETTNRAINTVYTNSTGGVIWVKIDAVNNGSSNANGTELVNGVSLGTQNVQAGYGVLFDWAVPSGDTYEFEQTEEPLTINSWFELEN